MCVCTKKLLEKERAVSQITRSQEKMKNFMRLGTILLMRILIKIY